MPWVKEGDVNLSYEVIGEGFPVMLFAPGGMRSAAAFWGNSPWDPREVLASDFTVVAMDQRNAGASTAPISAHDSWQTYADDHLRLLDALEIERCHIVGGCIGGAFAFKLMQQAPDRVAAAVIQQTIGFDHNTDVFYAMFDGWAVDQQAKDSALTDEVLSCFRSNMYDGEAVFSVGYEVIERLTHPLLILRGDDQYHPASVSDHIASIAQHATLIRDWKEDGEKTGALARAFLLEHSA